MHSFNLNMPVHPIHSFYLNNILFAIRQQLHKLYEAFDWLIDWFISILVYACEHIKYNIMYILNKYIKMTLYVNTEHFMI